MLVAADRAGIDSNAFPEITNIITKYKEVNPVAFDFEPENWLLQYRSWDEFGNDSFLRDHRYMSNMTASDRASRRRLRTLLKLTKKA